MTSVLMNRLVMLDDDNEIADVKNIDKKPEVAKKATLKNVDFIRNKYYIPKSYTMITCYDDYY